MVSYDKNRYIFVAVEALLVRIRRILRDKDTRQGAKVEIMLGVFHIFITSIEPLFFLILLLNFYS